MARAFELDYDGTRRPIETERALAVAHAGVPVIVEGALEEIGYLTRIVDLYLEVIGAVASPTVAADLRTRGLERMHDLLDPDQVVEILTHLDQRAVALAVPVASALFELTTSPPRPHYFICGRIFVRAAIPYRLVASSPHILQTGHLYGHLLPADKHSDYLLTHPQGALSLWCAVGPVTTGNTVALYEGSPSSPGRALTPALAPGDVLVFNSDMLHASVRNETDETRVAIGPRVVLGRRLRFGPGTHWRAWYDPALLDTPLAPFATLQSRLTPAALRRWRWQRKWKRERRSLSTSTDV